MQDSPIGVSCRTLDVMPKTKRPDRASRIPKLAMVSTDAADRVQITKHINAPALLRVSYGPGPDDSLPHRTDFTLEWNPQSRTYEASHVAFSRFEDGEAITGASVRRIPLGRLIEAIIDQTVRMDSETPHGTVQEVFATIRSRVELEGRLKPDPDTLELVAIVFEYGQSRGRKTTKLVEETFAIPMSTASHWVRLAKERGHLEDS